MIFEIMTLFPEMIRSAFSESILGRAAEKGIIGVNLHNIRDYTTDKHRKTDDYPFGGGRGMVMTVQPVFDCHKAICDGEKIHTIYMSPRGKVLTQKRAEELAKLDRICILCGHYEGIDERIIENIVDEELSIGDYVLTGGELPAAILTDCISRLIPGVLPASECYELESISSGLLEYPQYTRPANYCGMEIPEVLLSGNHANIDRWRREKSLALTLKKRPDMIEALEKSGSLEESDVLYLRVLRGESPEKVYAQKKKRKKSKRRTAENDTSTDTDSPEILAVEENQRKESENEQ